MDAGCRGGGAITGVFSGVRPTVRRGPGCGFGDVLGGNCHRERQGRSNASRWWRMHLYLNGRRSSLRLRDTDVIPIQGTTPHLPSSQLVLLATPFTPVVVVEATKPLEDITAIAGPATRVRKSIVPPSLGTPSKEPFTSKPLLWSPSSASPGGTDFAYALPARRGSCSYWRDVTISSITTLKYV